jgi:hypothetical protein
MSRFILALFTLFTLVGCGSSGGGSNPTPPPTVAVVSEYLLNDWNLLMDGNLYAEIEICDDGTVISGTGDGSIVEDEDKNRFVITLGIYKFEGVPFTFKKTACGRYYKNGAWEGYWCMSLKGDPYITADYVSNGKWNFILDWSNVTYNIDIVFNGTKITENTISGYIPDSGSIRFMGGEYVEIKFQRNMTTVSLNGTATIEIDGIGGSVSCSDGTHGSFGASKYPTGPG